MSGFSQHKKLDRDGSLITITQAHWRTHKGDMYHFSHRFAAVPKTNSVDVLISTGDTSPHITFNSSGEGKYYFDIYEGVTVSSDGTLVTTFKNNRNIPGAAETIFHHTPTVTGLGTKIHENTHGGGSSKPSQTSGESFSENEWNFADNTLYLLRMTNHAAAAADLSIIINFYEPS